MTNLITIILFIALLVLAFYWNFQQDQQRQKDVKESGKDFSYSEGCLSIPNVSEEVIRKERIKINFLNEKFEPKQMNCSGIIARVIQHEFDHLQGILFTERLSKEKKAMLESELKDITLGKIELKYEMSFHNN